MIQTCTVPHCFQPRIGRSNKCSSHRQALRRHGHPLQTSIKVPEFSPYRAAVLALWKANPDASMWTVMRARWGRCCDHARSLADQRSRGVPYKRHELTAADALLALDAGVEWQKLACTALGLYLYTHARPHRFADDEGIRFQLVRKVRGLDDLAVGMTWNPKTKTMHKVYRCMAPRAVRVLADYLQAVFAEAALLLRDHPKARPAPRLEVTEAKLMADSVRSMR